MATMKMIDEFKDIHKGGTILLAMCGKNLELAPPEKFPHPTIGVNTIHLHKPWTWQPDYYLTVDRRNWREYGDKIADQYRNIPKITPIPSMKQWRGENFYHFNNGPWAIWRSDQKSPPLWQDNILHPGITYSNISHIAFKLAWFMGAKTILITGMEHEPEKSHVHFWGKDAAPPNESLVQNEWIAGYKIIRDELNARGVDLLNISPKTFVPDEIIPKDSWKKWI